MSEFSHAQAFVIQTFSLLYNYWLNKIANSQLLEELEWVLSYLVGDEKERENKRRRKRRKREGRKKGEEEAAMKRNGARTFGQEKEQVSGEHCWTGSQVSNWKRHSNC